MNSESFNSNSKLFQNDRNRFYVELNGCKLGNKLDAGTNMKFLGDDTYSVDKQYKRDAKCHNESKNEKKGSNHQ